MTVADIFLKSYEITKPKRIYFAESYASWLISISDREGSGVKVPEVVKSFVEEGKEGYSAWVNAKIFSFIMKLYTLTNSTHYLDFAYRLLSWISWMAVDEKGYV